MTTSDRPAGPASSSGEPVLEITDLVKTFAPRRGRGAQPVRAVDGVSLSVRAGECLAIVGESGSGKSTLARTILRLVEPDSGAIRWRGTDLLAMPERELRRARRHMQMVFQDPYASLHPRRTVGQLIAEGWSVHPGVVDRRDRRERVRELLRQVGLPADDDVTYPSRLSGGQRQRVAIARALALEPDLLILDEPVSALDVSIQAQIIRLLMTLRDQLGLTYLFISHDLALVRLVADDVVVMQRGTIVESGRTADVFAAPQHEYTRTLLAASPSLGDPLFVAPDAGS